MTAPEARWLWYISKHPNIGKQHENVLVHIRNFSRAGKRALVMRDLSDAVIKKLENDGFNTKAEEGPEKKTVISW